MKSTAFFMLMGAFALVGCSQSVDSEYTDRMATEHAHDAPTANPHTEIPPSQPVTGEWVTFGDHNGQELRGYFARPEGNTSPLPGLIVIHEWWGLNDHIRAMTDRLAGEGYAALAVDMYHGKVAETPDSARVFMQGVMGNPASGLHTLEQASVWLTSTQNAPKLGIIGWCFGGAWSLNAAIGMPDKLNAAVIYYGNVNKAPTELAAIQTPILGIFGDQDQGIPVDGVRKFEAALDSLGKEVTIHMYEGADHAFANASGGRYHPEAAADAWKKTTAFLQQYLQP